MRYLRCAIRTLLFIPLCFVAFVLLAGVDTLRIGRTRKNALINYLYIACMRVIGLRATLKGELTPGPALIVANHCSYNDVLVIASLGDIFFTPKSDVRNWPLIGPLVGRFNVIFVDRKPGSTKQTQQNILAHLSAGGRICVFPEATTSDGQKLLPFKSSLFSLAEQWEGPQPLPVQPITVIYRRVDGKTPDKETWPKIAWYGDIGIVRHLLTFFMLRLVEAEAIAHPPITLMPGESRKELCERAEAIVAQAYPYGREVLDAH